MSARRSGSQCHRASSPQVICRVSSPVLAVIVLNVAVGFGLTPFGCDFGIGFEELFGFKVKLEHVAFWVLIQEFVEIVAMFTPLGLIQGKGKDTSTNDKRKP